METLRIKNLLKLKGMTMQQMADKMGINRVNLSSSINGNPTLQRLNEVAEILEVNVSELFNRQSEQRENNISGYLEFQGDIFKIEKLTDIESFIFMVKESKLGISE